MMPPLDASTLWLLGAGMLGSFLHAWVTFSSATWTRQATVETLLGGLGGVLLPNVPYFAALSPWSKLVVAILITYAASDFAINLAKQIGAKLPGLFGGKV